jgi:hypothetical protein
MLKVTPMRRKSPQIEAAGQGSFSATPDFNEQRAVGLADIAVMEVDHG